MRCPKCFGSLKSLDRSKKKQRIRIRKNPRKRSVSYFKSSSWHYFRFKGEVMHENSTKMPKVHNKFAHFVNLLNSNFILTSWVILLILQIGEPYIQFVNSSTASSILDTDARAVTITSKLENYHTSPNITTTTPKNGYLNVFSGNDSYGNFFFAFIELALQTSDKTYDVTCFHSDFSGFPFQ